MNPLYLPPRESTVDMEVQADKGERQLNRLGTRVRVLRCPGVHDVLMNERGVTTTERVTLEFVVGVLLGERIRPSPRLL
jgi:hypothetical protein